jgi:putative ABC transport system permease protein
MPFIRRRRQSSHDPLSHFETEITEELLFHLEMRTEELMREGMSAEEAERTARELLGAPEEVISTCVDIDAEGLPSRRRNEIMFETLQDLRFSGRVLRRDPLFTLVILITLAVGIGANTAIFSVVNEVLLRPLPYDEPDQVAFVLGTRNDDIIGRGGWLAYPEVEDMRRGSASLTALSAFQGWGPTLYGAGDPIQVNGASVSAQYFDVLGVRPALGRFFLPEEGELGHEPVVVLSYGFWQRRFGSDPDVVGSTVNLNMTAYTVVGVAPAGLEDPYATGDVWRSRPPSWDSNRQTRVSHSWQAIGRVRSGTTLEQAQADLDRVWANMEAEYPQLHPAERARLVRAKDFLVGPVRQGLLILFGSVGLVLLIACANVANLLLSRAVDRNREMALRAALGAGRSRVVRQLLIEICTVFLIGGGLGLVLAWVGTDLLLALAAQSLPRVTEIPLSGSALLFTLAVSVATGAVFGLAPALRATRANLASSLQVGGRTTTTARKGQRLRSGLVVAEVALALVLLTGAGLLMRSFHRLNQVEAGFQDEGVLTLFLSPRVGDYPQHGDLTRLYREVEERLAAAPGVEGAGGINILPLTGAQNCELLLVEGEPPPDPQTTDPAELCAEVRVVTPGYFQAMGVRLLRGRSFTSADDTSSTPVVVINETLARVRFGEDDPIGKRISVFETSPTIRSEFREVVGVVNDIRQMNLASPAWMAFYTVHPQEWHPLRRARMNFVVKVDGDPAAAAEGARAAVMAVDENVRIAAVQPMERVVSRNLAQPRFRTALLLVFALVALLLASVGIGGVIAYTVARRVPEIGLRKVLGAEQGDVYGLVLGQSLRLTLAGVGVGLLGALASTRLLAGLLYQVTATDPLTFLAVPVFLVGVALLASYLPARRAGRVEAMVALKSE